MPNLLLQLSFFIFKSLVSKVITIFKSKIKRKENLEINIQNF